jgi:hypothetical protein
MFPRLVRLGFVKNSKHLTFILEYNNLENCSIEEKLNLLL